MHVHVLLRQIGMKAIHRLAPAHNLASISSIQRIVWKLYLIEIELIQLYLFEIKLFQLDPSKNKLFEGDLEINLSQFFSSLERWVPSPVGDQGSIWFNVSMLLSMAGMWMCSR